MQKLTGLIFAAFILIVPARAQKYPGTPADHKKHKKETDLISARGIAQRNDWKYAMKNGNVTTRENKTGEIRYDKAGRTKEISSFNEAGFRQSITVFKYDSLDLLISETEFTDRGELLGKTLYSYNEEGYLAEITLYNSVEYIIARTICSHSKKTKSFTRRIMFSPDSVRTKTVSFYTDMNNGYISQEWVYRGEHALQYKKRIQRDEKHRIRTEVYTNAKGKQMYYLKYIYNQEGNLRLIERYFPSGVKVKSYDFNFTPAGLISGEVKYNQNGEIIHYHKYMYQ